MCVSGVIGKPGEMAGGRTYSTKVVRGAGGLSWRVPVSSSPGASALPDPVTSTSSPPCISTSAESSGALLMRTSGSAIADAIGDLCW